MLASSYQYLRAMHKKVWKQAEASGAAGKTEKNDAACRRRTRLFNNQKAMRKIFAQIHTESGKQRWRLFIAGGAAINPQVIKDYEAMGTTDDTGLWHDRKLPDHRCPQGLLQQSRIGGDPYAGHRDKDNRSLTADGIGEIICKGPSVMLGYYKDPEATAEAIRDGWLYTGDYGRFDDEGFLYICGRKKNVIVSKNGKNIFPEEIEYAAAGAAV